MTELSPAAQAIYEAAIEQSEYPNDAEWVVINALRAVAEQVVLPKYQYADWGMAHVIMQELQDIADELEAPTNNLEGTF